ncbi:MAG: hypothetical protein NZM42_02885 [Gemmatales bacterium]|nr:hypothetical protein [Gemmatales bacterium]MDW8221343.1 hypothetical protein [Gemmatales bacterium]
MSATRTLSLLNGWETIRYELLNSRICDLNLRIEGSPLEPLIQRLYRELERRQLRFRPQVYLTDGWGCPDRVPIIGVPFYLADRRLARIEEEQTGEVEDEHYIMMLLRHEAGHAYNYAYRLYERRDWQETFGPFDKPYKDNFRPNPFSKQFVRHIVHHRYGRTYAQKHPDEDFAETFAVWLTPRSGWRRRYRYWPAIKKLLYIDQVMKEIRQAAPLVESGKRLAPVEELTLLLAEHYGQRAERYRAEAQGYVDDKLRELFPPAKTRDSLSASIFLRKYSAIIIAQLSRWSELDEDDAEALLIKMIDRAEVLGLTVARRKMHDKVIEVVALAMALAMNFSYTGRVTG